MIVECCKCNLAQVGPDGKVIVVAGVMPNRTDGGEDYCRFDPSATDGRCPRCGRSNYELVDAWTQRLFDEHAEMLTLLRKLLTDEGRYGYGDSEVKDKACALLKRIDG